MRERNQSLDVLRGIAVLLVISYHLPFIPILKNVGWCGVDLFFVLSGYLISGLLFRDYQETGSIGLRRFWLRRGFKIWPSLYVFMIAMAIPLLYSPNGPDWHSLFAASLFVSNYSGVARLVGHTWTLAVEEQFYFIFPLILFGLIRLSRMSLLPWMYTATFAGCCLLHLLRPEHFPSGIEDCADALFTGVILRYAEIFAPSLFNLFTTNLCGVLSCALLAVSLSTTLPIGRSGLALGFGGLLAWSTVRRSPMILRPLALIGIYSYSIYLWQQPLTRLYHDHQTALGFLLISTLSIAVGIGMSRIVEIPALRMREKLIPSRRQVPNAPIPVRDGDCGFALN